MGAEIRVEGDVEIDNRQRQFAANQFLCHPMFPAVR